MPSPFPGMDPYLEGSLWTTFHFAIDYTQPPEVPLEGDAAPLVDSLLQAAGKRSL